MPVFAELEFTVGPQSAPKAGYPISPRLRMDGQDEIFNSDLLPIDLDELSNLRAERSKYEARLSELFFQSPNAKDALDKACAQLDQAGPGNMLRAGACKKRRPTYGRSATTPAIIFCMATPRSS